MFQSSWLKSEFKSQDLLFCLIVSFVCCSMWEMWSSLIPGDLLSVTCNGVNASLRSNGNGGGRTGIEIDGKQDIRLLKPYKTRRRMKRPLVRLYHFFVAIEHLDTGICFILWKTFSVPIDTLYRTMLVGRSVGHYLKTNFLNLQNLLESIRLRLQECRSYKGTQA